MKTLYLLRHAKAETASRGQADIARPLSARGREACLDIGTHMKKNHYFPKLALCSPSVRTRETLARVSDACGSNPPCRVVDKLYLAEAEEMMHYIRLVSGAFESAIVVGHNPGMHHAALMLASREHTPLRQRLELKYPTGTLCVMRFDVPAWSDIAEERGELVDFASPQGL